MSRADGQVVPIRPAVLPARDRSGISSRSFWASADWREFSADLEAIAATRPEVASVMRALLSIAFELSSMLPRPMVERLVEQIIEQLDEHDGDPDIEPTEDFEPDY